MADAVAGVRRALSRSSSRFLAFAMRTKPCPIGKLGLAMRPLESSLMVDCLHPHSTAICS